MTIHMFINDGKTKYKAVINKQTGKKCLRVNCTVFVASFYFWLISMHDDNDEDDNVAIISHKLDNNDNCDDDNDKDQTNRKNGQSQSSS